MQLAGFYQIFSLAVIHDFGALLGLGYFGFDFYSLICFLF